MAKTYVDIVKYMVEARFDISGAVEKPDVIGAVFGQTEGLLGADLDLRELQKNGKIGRIEIDANTIKGRTSGKLILPSSLGRVETCILAAAVESVDRVGPFDTKFNIVRVEDTRNEKRSRVINRAKELVKNMLTTTVPDSREISDIVEAEVKSSTVTLYGNDKLPAGPDVNKSETMILVEGRADVINLLRNDITNCISVGGASGSISTTITDLCRKKEVTVFLDGDRGGSLILNGLIGVGAEIDFVCRAPDGKEVEELTRKEIIKALRFKVPIDQATSSKSKDAAYNKDHSGRVHNNRHERHGNARPERYEESISSPTQIAERLHERGAGTERHEEEERTRHGGIGVESIDEGPSDDSSPIKEVDFGESDRAEHGTEDERYVKALEELKNTLRGRLYSESGDMLAEMPIRDLIHAVEDTRNASVVVFDGIITQRLVDIANRSRIKAIYGIRPSDISRKYEGIILFTSEQGVL